MSITATKITARKVLRGQDPVDALVATAGDINPIIDDLTSLDGRVDTLENAPVATVTPGLDIRPTSTLFTADATATAAEIATGNLIKGSLGNITVTLPSATALAAELGADQGSTFEFVAYADGTNLTLAVGAGISVITPAIIGGDNLVVSSANIVGVFKLVFQATSVANLIRIA